MKNFSRGRHTCVEVYNVSFDKLNDKERIEETCVTACKMENLQILNTYTHHFDPYGVTCTITLGESHLALHTWPEKGCVAFDIFTCGNSNPRSAALWVLKYFDSEDYIIKDIER